MKKWQLDFTDGTTLEVEAPTIQEAWIIGKITAQDKKTYLLKVTEKRI